jgi:hypothetical protein
LPASGLTPPFWQHGERSVADRNHAAGAVRGPGIEAYSPPLHWNQMQGKFVSFKFYEKVVLICVEFGQNPLSAANCDFKALG